MKRHPLDTLPSLSLGALLVASLLACSGDQCKNATKSVVSKTTKGSKNMVKGAIEGVEEGRKDHDPLGGTLVVTSMAQLRKLGGVSVHQITSQGTDSSEVTLAFENTQDKPLKVQSFTLSATDRDGFAQKVSKSTSNVTVPPNAKVKFDFKVSTPKENLGKIQVWGTEVKPR